MLQSPLQVVLGWVWGTYTLSQRVFGALGIYSLVESDHDSSTKLILEGPLKVHYYSPLPKQSGWSLG